MCWHSSLEHDKHNDLMQKNVESQFFLFAKAAEMGNHLAEQSFFGSMIELKKVSINGGHDSNKVCTDHSILCHHD